LTIDVTRLVEEVGFAPRTTVQTAEEFIDRVDERSAPRSAEAIPAGPTEGRVAAV
jgi:hypothetical protein